MEITVAYLFPDLLNLYGDKGNILAYDIDAKRLENIKPRIKRLNVKNIELTDIIADFLIRRNNFCKYYFCGFVF